MDLGLGGKVALVCAASRGLGKACAEVLSQEGATVAICSRDLVSLERTAADITAQTGHEVFPFACDLGNHDQVDILVSKVLETCGHLNIVVHNAGGPPSKPAAAVTDAEWDASLRLNLQSLIWLAQAAVPAMRQEGAGRIIAITSVSVKHTLDNMVLSNTTRLGVAGFAKTLANELAPDNILVNVVCPGPTATQRMKDIIATQAEQKELPEAEVAQTWTKLIPLGRLGEPAEFGNVVAFLASDRASFITGAVIPVDGGMTRSPI
jgi:3-oxoacyl-[acyl-carrier protein] reductase